MVGDIPTSIAHEMFHCVQYASLSPEQMATYGAGGDWWIEGSAEYFANLTLPGRNYHPDLIEAFQSRATSTSLLDFTY